MRRLLAVGLILSHAGSALAQGGGANVTTRFQDPAQERRVEVDEGGSAGRGRGRESLEDRLYLRERPDALGSAARAFQEEQLERLLRDRERLLEVRRSTAIELLEQFIREEPESAAEMPDALLRLAELRWEEARALHVRAYGAWQEAGRTGPEPAGPDYTVAMQLYDRILTRHRDFSRYDLVLYMKAFVLTETGRAEEAIALYRRILDEFPQSRFVPDAHMALAEERFAEGDFAGALARYELVLPHRDSDFYGMALFKSAWCLWRLDRSTEAATRFRRVLDLGRGAGQVSAEQRSRLRELQTEALEYLIQVFTDDERNTAQDLFTFLEEIGGERYADRVLVRLASRFYEQQRWEHGIGAYRLVLERLPGDERAPRWQLAIARGRAALGEPDAAVAALAEMARLYVGDTDWTRQQSDPTVVAETSDLIERAIRVRAMRWHDLAQRENRRSLFERAAELYGIYLEHFPDSEQSYDLRFYRGEILFHRLERWDDAGRTYLAAAQQNPTGRYTRDALYNAIGAFERVREAQLARCAGGAAPPAPAPPPTEEPAEEEPCGGETENDRRFAAAIELYVERFPEDPDLPEILFRQGRLYYDRQVYDPAVRLFGQLLERFPNSPYSVTAGELILESFNRARDYQNIESWARRLREAPAFQTEESQRRLAALILQSVFATGEQLAGRGEHDAAAQAYLRAAREFPRDERAPQAYFNAGVAYQADGNVSGAASAYDQLIQSHPRTPVGAQGAWAGAQMYESIAQFSDAARFYESYGEHFPQGEQSSDALYNATLLRMTAGDNDAAVRNGQRFLERFGSHESADEVTFLIARAHAQAERWAQAAEVYNRFIRRSRDVARQIEAHTRLGQVLERSGDAEAANRSYAAAVRLARRAGQRLADDGRYYAAQARYLQAMRVLAEYEAVQIAGPMAGLRQRLERKSELLRRAAEGFAEVVQFNVAEWVTASLFQIGRSYELYAEGLRNAPTPEGLTEEEEQAYFDQLQGFVVPIEERALEAFEGGYATAMRLRIFNSWTAQLRQGLTRLNDVEYPRLREMGGALAESAAIPTPGPLDGLRRGPPPSEASAGGEAAPARGAEQPDPNAAPAAGEPTRGATPRRRRRR
ncbi:MAG: tetratricopeptide repeat protein [Sandaracinaceae bacterium]|nr:tetratricopeptide repeat protein [Sandaracinaceae bacterium]